jgi:hypothetical protein
MGAVSGRRVAGDPPEKGGFRKGVRMSDPVFTLSPASALA